MLWSLLRNATQRGLSWNTPCLFQRSRFSGLCKSFDVISSHFRHGPHRRTIYTRCYRELDIAKGSIYQHARCLKFLSSLLPNVNRRFVGTRVGLNSTSASNMRNKTTAIYTIAVAVAIVGLSYLAVPLYRLYCQATGLGGTVKREEAGEKIEQMERKPERDLLIRFNADKSASMQWNFRPQQSSIRLVPGETALAFYTATNPTDEPITGISTYNVIPFEAGQYFNKIQCFCFEEQRLNPHEQVDMPVFFYIDPEFTEDPAMVKVDIITLSYTFFEAKEAEKLGL
ncbi:cytochrome c oxidase assembly protein COX11, mitochondrial-like isoform X2 [Orbicella faveolata]|uniref:cytochrome c oxidase assembly protein COX11, mitochondrial-like isoform X1 n=1 Tax=Orbicella faveolata TaxID=48498 RepID=UPI0009E5918C|nr:cytochrome c oxidase assembly protein COX11, mitochondrial-like isoform X1 [Orbicella faveolata]XP_020622732.1 cytochrome c oxidase assembly protein COX11, mitochondrial-like isoform X2 [Orbicella faveolata]